MADQHPAGDYWDSILGGAQVALALPEWARVVDASAAVAETRRQRIGITGIAALAESQPALFADAVPAVAAWVLLLGRLAGQNDVAIVHLAADGSAQPVRQSLDDALTGSGLLQAVRRQLQQAAGQPQAAAAALADWLQLAGDSQLPCQVRLDVNADGGASLASGPLVLHLDLAADTVSAAIEFDASRYLASEVGVWGDCWLRLLRGLSAEPDSAVQALPLLEPQQARDVLAFGNDNAIRWYGAVLVHELFEQQVERTPDAIALAYAGAVLTYRQLNQRANQLAHHLRGYGVGADDRVAVYLPRGLDLIVAIMAVLKVGAAYVPLDPMYPVERLAYTLRDSEPKILLSQSVMTPDWRELAGEDGSIATVVDIAADADLWRQAATDNPSPADIGLRSDHLAYVLYTSGSTGQPKGVAMPHAPLVNLIQWQLRQPGSEHPQATLQFAALGFDVAFQETFATLCNGGTLHLLDHDTRLSASALFDFIVEHAIERVFLPYFALQMLAEAMPQRLSADADGPACKLREVITAGEQLRIDPGIEAFFRQLPQCRLHNHYGPTESHVVTALSLPADAASWPRLPSIGRPIANARVYVLDDRQQPVPHGVAGELYLAGPVLARGYLHQPAMTAARFLPDPFADDAQARMYRTGDLGRWLPDGTLDYMGRKDFQVKIRGFRVELGEIEARMMAFAGIRQAGVLAREDRPGLKRLVAYFSSHPDAAAVDVEALRGYLMATLPDYMVPVAFVAMPTLPLSANGKLDRLALPAPGRARPDWIGSYQAPRNALETTLCGILGDALDIDALGRDDNFFELGGTSLLAVRVLEQIRLRGLGEITALALFREPTAAALANALGTSEEQGVDAARLPAARVQPGDAAEPIAIIAMAGRFPGAASVEALWQNLCAGNDGIRHFGMDELDPSIPESLRRDPDYVPARGILDDVDKFDAAFFGISPKEAELMDPQQRIFLELCWECMERAGEVPDDGRVPVGVFAGMYNASYYQKNVLAHPQLVEKLGAFQVMLDNEKDYIATRVAHKLNLTGPAISVHTACSTSLVAICQAIDSLRGGQCDMALAGGIAVACPVRSGHLYQEGAMLSPDGRTRSFDADARGTIFSDGGAVLLLKRLSDAIADGNPIHALIRGGAVNNDGGNKASFTAPSSAGQAAVVALAQRNAGVPARSIGYVESHGTATPVGDPIEVEGLTRAFRQNTDDSGFCLLGSVKSNLGHTITAAGATGTIKAALALAQELIPGTAHFNTPNPAIDFAATPFRVTADNHPWPRDPQVPRRAGVSSFGVGGTNAHVVLEEAPVLPPSDSADGPQLLVLSARTPAVLANMGEQLAAHLQAQPALSLADVAWTLATGRKRFPHRLALAADNIDDAVARLRSPELAAVVNRNRAAQAREVVFMFPGQGSQYLGMGRQLHEREPVFREAFDRCAELLQPEMNQDLRALVFGNDEQALLPTAVMQPSLFAIEYALAQWWLAQGVQPVAMIGHSVGEFVAATLAGVFELPDALRLVARRGRLMQSMPGGAMLSVRLPLASLLPRLPASLSLAAENAPGACVVAGEHQAIAGFQQQLESDSIACRLLRTSHAFHSSMMEPVVPAFRAEVEAVARQAPSVPIVSTALADWLDRDSAVSADYWARHLREPVRFSSAVARVLDLPGRALLEVGPRSTLSLLSRQQPGLKQHHAVVIASLADAPEHESRCLLDAAGQLWAAGGNVEPAGFDHRQRRQRLRLPTYPFEKHRHWVDALPALPANVVVHPATAALTALETPMSVASEPAPSAPTSSATASTSRRVRLLQQVKEVFEDVAGFDLEGADEDANFIELGLDSLMLTQVALQLQKAFSLKLTFRQLMSEYASLGRLVAGLDAQLPSDPVDDAPAAGQPVAPALSPQSHASASPVPPMPMPVLTTMAASPAAAGNAEHMRRVIDQQMQLMSQQLALLAGMQALPASDAHAPAAPAATPTQPAQASTVLNAQGPAADTAEGDAEPVHARYDVKKAFGAIARIDASASTELDAHQRGRLDQFIARYTARTPKSKAFTQQHRGHMADPRVVTGFRPLTKEIVYQIVIDRSRGSHLWDIDGHEYVDALNGFGTSLFGWQPDFVIDAVRRQLDSGYEIGPQHPLAGEVAQLVCELTGHDRAALCNTGSEAVLGAMRIARTVTGRDTIVLFSGSYHGINDEVIVRAGRNLRAMPAAPGILRNAAENVLVLDYGTPETLRIIRERAHELAAVLVEPVQSRRPDFQPIEFLREVRAITEASGAALIFDEVITGFRSHPGGAQALFGIKADLATYGKVVGGGYPIGVMAGKRAFMDALDGGHWQYGDDSIPEVGVTYFAGTFVRHPMTLAAAKASLQQMQQHGPALQERLNQRTAQMAEEINRFCADVGAPLRIKHFASLWRTHFEEDHPLQDLLFAMMRSRGIHILDNFPCFFTTAHSEADFRAITDAYKESVLELQEANFLPRHAVTPRTLMDAAQPPVDGARLGRDPQGRPAWYVPDPQRDGQYLQVGA
ncbi:polyketide synthase [Pseudoxanthomonas dokdonensis]|uniref:polyketide synthase n=1 Tax=Pseudoxanthomonas dokdonensis TaxID=344882 RepID=UPI000A85E521|nr:polyketide synthase [Pseudoxanthomonas dokdonensis]